MQNRAEHPLRQDNGVRSTTIRSVKWPTKWCLMKSGNNRACIVGCCYHFFTIPRIVGVIEWCRCSSVFPLISLFGTWLLLVLVCYQFQFEFNGKCQIPFNCAQRCRTQHGNDVKLVNKKYFKYYMRTHNSFLHTDITLSTLCRLWLLASLMRPKTHKCFSYRFLQMGGIRRKWGGILLEWIQKGSAASAKDFHGWNAVSSSPWIESFSLLLKSLQNLCIEKSFSEV